MSVEQHIPSALMEVRLPLMLRGALFGYGWKRAEALQLVDALEGTGVIILGGDVVRLIDSEAEPTYDNWYCDPLLWESPEDYSRRSLARARTYIASYTEPPDSNIAYGIEMTTDMPTWAIDSSNETRSMSVERHIPSALMERRIPLMWRDDLFGYGWKRAEALQVVDALEGTGVIILGGDVVRLIDGEAEHTYDNWYSNPLPSESQEDYSRRSLARTREYIASHPEPPDSNIAYGIVMTTEMPT